MQAKDAQLSSRRLLLPGTPLRLGLPLGVRLLAVQHPLDQLGGAVGGGDEAPAGAGRSGPGRGERPRAAQEGAAEGLQLAGWRRPPHGRRLAMVGWAAGEPGNGGLNRRRPGVWAAGFRRRLDSRLRRRTALVPVSVLGGDSTHLNWFVWDLPGDVLAAPESALCGWTGVKLLSLPPLSLS